MVDDWLHYTMCGLENVYLVNGYYYKDGRRGRTLHIENQEGLHLAIGCYLIGLRRSLTGNELRFLRYELGLSQSNLAQLLGESELTVARREKKQQVGKRPTAQERLIRYLYEQHVGGNELLRGFLESLADLDEIEADSLAVEKNDDDSWKRVEPRAA